MFDVRPEMSEQVAFNPWLLIVIGAVAVLGVVAFALYWFLGRAPRRGIAAQLSDQRAPA
jgi:hypothetical protein